jgi:hypothetical protein
MGKIENAAKWKVQLQQHLEAVGKERDALRSDIDEMEALEECCEEAYDNIQRAIDALSELA